MKEILEFLKKYAPILALVLPWLAYTKQFGYGVFNDRFIFSLFGQDVAFIFAVFLSMLLVPLAVLLLKILLDYIDVYILPRITYLSAILVFMCFGFGSLFEHHVMNRELFEGINIYWGYSALCMGFVLTDIFKATEETINA